MPADNGGTPEKPSLFNVAKLLRAQQKMLGRRAAEAQKQGTQSSAAGPMADTDHRAERGDVDSFKHAIGTLWRQRAWVTAAALTVIAFSVFHAYVLEEDNFRAIASVLISRNLVGEAAGDSVLDFRPYVSNVPLAKIARLEPTTVLAADAIRGWAGVGEGRPGEELLGSTANDLTPMEMALVSDRARLIGFLQGSAVDVAPDDENVSVGIAVTGPYPAVVEAAANAMAESLVFEFERRRERGSIINALKKQIDENDGSLSGLERRIVGLQKEHSGDEPVLSAFPLETNMQRQLLTRYLMDAENIERRITEVRERIRLLGEQIKEFESEGESVVVPSHLVARLVDLELEFQEAQRKYTPRHPKLRRLESDINKVREAIHKVQMAPGLYGASTSSPSQLLKTRIEGDVATSKAEMAGLTERLKKTRDTAARIREKISDEETTAASVKLESLEREKRVQENISIMLETELRKAELARVKPTGKGNSSAALEVVYGKSGFCGPNRLLIVAVGIIFGIIVGGGLAFVLETLDETVRLPAEMRRLTGLPTLSAIPSLDDDPFVRPENARSRVADAFAVLRNHIRYSAANNPEGCLLVTSSLPEEGKSYVCANLAISFAQEGNTVVMLDADLQRAQRHLITDVVAMMSTPQMGLGELLSGQTQLDNVLSATEMPNLFYIAAGARVPNSPRLLRSELFARTLSELQRRFDIVIVDTPPVLNIVDATIAATRCRSVLVVVRFGYTRRGELAECTHRLVHVNAPLIGTVLNRATSVIGSYYGRRY